MRLKELVETKRNDIKNGRFTSEAAVSQGIVLPLLNELGWAVFDTHIVWPEYSAGGGRVDFALCNPADCPIIFIEVKRVGNADGADRQLFEYTFHQGVPMAILTDGQEWHFYLPAEQGAYEERRVYKLDLMERDLDECERRLLRYLQFSEVASGSALDSAKADYRDINRYRQIKKFLPKAWLQLIQQPDDLLSELLADKVEDICGFKPDLDTCSEYIRASLSTTYSQPSASKPKKLPKLSHKIFSNSSQTARSSTIGYEFKKSFYPCGSAREVMVKVLQTFDNIDQTFLDRFASRKHGRKRRFVAKDRYELYPGRPDLAENHYVEIKPGWYLGTNYSRQNISDILRMACDVAGVSFGKELKISL